MKILVIGDMHYKITNAPETEEFTEKVIAYILKVKPDIIVILGDVLDRHEKIDLLPFTRATKFLENCANFTKTFILIGNHDVINNSVYLSKEHAFGAHKHIENLIIVDDILREGDLIFVPYVYPGRFMETLNHLDNWKTSRVIFAHQEFTGAKMGAVVSTAEEWPKNNPLIISGHIHDYQEIQTNLIYTGACIQHAFNDNEDKSISLLTIDKEIKHERVFLDCKKKKIVHLNPESLKTYVPEKNVNLKIIISGTTGELKPLEKSIKVRELRKQGIKVHFRSVVDKEKFTFSSNHSYYNTLFELVGKDEGQKKWLKILGNFNA